MKMILISFLFLSSLRASEYFDYEYHVPQDLIELYSSKLQTGQWQGDLSAKAIDRYPKASDYQGISIWLGKIQEFNKLRQDDLLLMGKKLAFLQENTNAASSQDVVTQGPQDEAIDLQEVLRFCQQVRPSLLSLLGIKDISLDLYRIKKIQVENLESSYEFLSQKMHWNSQSLIQKIKFCRTYTHLPEDLRKIYFISWYIHHISYPQIKYPSLWFYLVKNFEIRSWIEDVQDLNINQLIDQYFHTYQIDHVHFKDLNLNSKKIPLSRGDLQEQYKRGFEYVESLL